jgi:mRNA interferase MazF
MERFVKGDVVVLEFPFSDLTKTKKRPALVVVNLKGDDLILVQITSIKQRDEYSINLDFKDLDKGKLNISSSIRPNRLFTADKSIIEYILGSLNKRKIKEVEDELVKIFRN